MKGYRLLKNIMIRVHHGRRCEHEVWILKNIRMKEDLS